MIRRRSLFLRVVIYVPLTGCALVALMPLYWLLTGSIKPAKTLLKMPPDLFPAGFTFEHFDRLFELSSAGIWLHVDFTPSRLA